MVVPCRHLRIVVQHDEDLPQGGCESSVRETRIFRGFGLKMAETRRRTLCATMLKD